MSFKKFYSELWKRSFVSIYRSISQMTSQTELKLSEILKKEFPKATNIKVSDISGGCGAMFEIYVETEEFNGLNKVKQHMIVNDALKNEIKDMHGIRIFTSIPNQ